MILKNCLGRHVLAEIYECIFEILNDREKVEAIMVNAPWNQAPKYARWYSISSVLRESVE